MRRVTQGLMLCLALLCTHSVFAESESIPIERIFASPSLDGTAPRNLSLSPDGKRVTFLRGKELDYERLDLWEYHIDSNKTRLLVDSDELHKGDESLSDEEKARRERLRLSGTGIVSYTWSADGKSILFPLAGDAYLYTLATESTPASVRRLLDTEAFETDIKLSPKGNYIGFVRDQNLFIKSIADDKEIAITTQGGGNIKYGMAEFVAQEEMKRLTGYWFAPDESHIAFTRVDESPVDIITRSEIYADRIDLIEQRYPRAGTPNVLISAFVQSIADGTRHKIELNKGLTLAKGSEEDFYFAYGKWANPSVFTFQVQDRKQQQLVLNAYSVESQDVKTLITEMSDTWVNLLGKPRFLNDKSHFIWESERNGYHHLYLYHLEKGLVKTLTSGEWVVTALNAIDEDNQDIYFSGRKDTPLENHLYKVSMENGDITRISKRDGFHSVNFSDNADVYVDSFSTINSPPQVSLHSQNGKHLTWLTRNKVNSTHPLWAYKDSLVEPTFGTLNAVDGTELHYRLYTPKKTNGKHPVIVYLYGGPGAQVVTNRWAGRRGLLMQHWVSKGYVVFTVDNRGSNYRGKAFEDHLYEKMGGVEVEDQIAGVKFLRTLPYVDASRIGVHGHSYGGYMTLMTMFKASDYFAAGVSGAPVTDWGLYDTHYTERYMGLPGEVQEAYTKASVFPYADGLKGDLLIYHGMADDNVLFTHSTKLYKHLQDNAKHFEVMDYPGKKHSIRGKNTGIHLYNTITNFFDRSL